LRKLLLRQASSAVEVAALKGGDRILLCQTGLHRFALGSSGARGQSRQLLDVFPPSG
jgi:hypothetical protein